MQPIMKPYQVSQHRGYSDPNEPITSTRERNTTIDFRHANGQAEVTNGDDDISSEEDPNATAKTIAPIDEVTRQQDA